MPATEPTTNTSTTSSGAQQAQGEEVPPELKQGVDGKLPTKGQDVKPGQEMGESVSYGEGTKDVKSANLAS